jgi:hypothetical protein
VLAVDDNRVVAQKLTLLNVMLNQSKKVRQIEESDDVDAQGLLIQSRELSLIAKKAFDEGDAQGAGAAINGALKALDSARAIFRDRPNATLVERARYKELQDSIRSFRSSLTGEAAANLERDKLDALLAVAEKEMKRDDYVAANAQLNQAYQLIVAAVNSGYKVSTLVYSLDFETPKQEYQYELRRYRGNELLIGKLLAQKEQSQTKELVTRYLEQAAQTHKLAQDQAKQGGYQRAIASMEKASSQLKRAMGMLGIRF